MENKISQSQKLMVFVLSMSLYGLATLFTELIPSFQVGIVEFSVEYFLFIPLTLAMLFDPLSAGLGAATGELVFSEIMLGQFGGLGDRRLCSGLPCEEPEKPCRSSGGFNLRRVHPAFHGNGSRYPESTVRGRRF